MKKRSALPLLSLLILLHAGCASQGKIEFVHHEAKQIDVMVDGRLFTSYVYDHDLLKPSLYPVTSPSGSVVTRGYPFEELEGESRDHPHHAGVFFTYSSNHEVNGDSFWNLHGGPQQIRHIRIEEMSGGRNSATLATISHWINSRSQPLLEEKRVMVFHASGDEYKIDFTIHLTAIDTTVTFEDTKEGMFAIRVADWLAESTRGTRYTSTGEYLNAEGERTEKGIWGKRSSWVRLEGKKDEKAVGVAVYHHPGSTNYPTYWHARGYGCFSANPIGQFEFQQGNQVANPEHRSLRLEPGETGVFKFRMTIYEGERTKEYFDRDFDAFSKI